jgi:hypothetical protein
MGSFMLIALRNEDFSLNTETALGSLLIFPSQNYRTNVHIVQYCGPKLISTRPEKKEEEQGRCDQEQP